MPRRGRFRKNGLDALKFHLRVELGGEAPPDPDAVERINALLAEVSES